MRKTKPQSNRRPNEDCTEVQQSHLTDQQRAFAAFLGRILADRWQAETEKSESRPVEDGTERD